MIWNGVPRNSSIPLPPASFSPPPLPARRDRRAAQLEPAPNAREEQRETRQGLPPKAAGEGELPDICAYVGSWIWYTGAAYALCAYEPAIALGDNIVLAAAASATALLGRWLPVCG